jgi:hypothetical protein
MPQKPVFLPYDIVLILFEMKFYEVNMMRVIRNEHQQIEYVEQQIQRLILMISQLIEVILNVVMEQRVIQLFQHNEDRQVGLVVEQMEEVLR